MISKNNYNLIEAIKVKKRVEAGRRKYIRDHWKKPIGMEKNDSPEVILRVVRYILRTPEGQDVRVQAEKIMKRVNKGTLYEDTD